MGANQAHLDDIRGFGIFVLIAEALRFRSRQPDQSDGAEIAPAVAPLPSRGLGDRIDDWFWKQRQSALEAYLGKAQDVFELEARIRDLEREVPDRCF